MAELNKKHQIEYVAITVFVLVALIIGINRFRKGEKDDEVFSRTEFNKKWQEVEILEANVPQKEEPVMFSVSGDTTPFKSLFDKEGQGEGILEEKIVLPAMKFEGMIWQGHRPQAIIDNKVYDVNDTIEIETGGTEDEVRIKAIDKDGIHLDYKGKEFIVRPKIRVDKE